MKRGLERPTFEWIDDEGRPAAIRVLFDGGVDGAREQACRCPTRGRNWSKCAVPCHKGTTVTQAEMRAATEAVKVAVSIVKHGKVVFHREGQVLSLVCQTFETDGYCDEQRYSWFRGGGFGCWRSSYFLPASSLPSQTSNQFEVWKGGNPLLPSELETGLGFGFAPSPSAPSLHRRVRFFFSLVFWEIGGGGKVTPPSPPSKPKLIGGILHLRQSPVLQAIGAKKQV